MPTNIKKVLVLALLAAACGCTAGDKDKGKDEGTAAVQAAHLKVFICEPALAVFHTQADWDRFWTEHKPDGPGASVPQVDFGRFTAVLASTGRTNAGAEDVTIPRVTAHGRAYYEVVVHTDKAGEGCAVTRCVACPTDVVLVPNDRSVRLTEELAVRNCRDK